MSKKISLSTTVVLVLLAALLTFQVTFVTLEKKYLAALQSTSSAFDKLNYVDSLYRQNYVGEIDEEQLSDDLIRGYIAGIGDKYGSYMTKDEFTAYKEESSGELVGIGIRIIYNGELGALEIISVMKDSPALEAGVEPGDLITMVGDESVATLGYYPAVAKMQGELGSLAVFTVRRGENYAETVEFSIARAKVDNVTVTYNMYEDDIGIIRISEFAENTGESVRLATDDLIAQGAVALVFDVRYNPGGALTGIVDTLDDLLPKGPIIRIVDREGKEESIDSDAACLTIPMAVLVNGSTASAAELFTSALQDYGLATIIGTQTYGKGTMQTVTQLPDGSGLSISYRMYNPPFSDNYEGVGITPDVVLDLDEALKEKNFYKITEEEDNQLQTAIKILRGELTPTAND